MRHKFVYSCSVKICASGLVKLLERIFCRLLVVEAFSLQTVFKMLEKVIVGWWEVRWIWWMRQNITVQFFQLLKHWLCNMWSGVVVEKNWALCVDQCQLHVLQFLVQLTYFLEGLMLKLQYFGHLMQRANSLEKTLVLGNIEGKRRRGRQRMTWLDGITDSMDMSLSNVQEMVKDRETQRAAVHGVTKSQTWLSDWTTNQFSEHVSQM